MGAAEVIACEEVRASKQGDPWRPQLQERLDPWLATLETQGHAPPSPFPEVPAPVWALRPQLPGGIPETLVTHGHRRASHGTQGTCPRCPGVVQAREPVCRTVETMVGPVQLARPYLSCRACREGRDPLDDALGLVAGWKQRDMQQAVAPWVPEVPWDTAPGLCGPLPGMHCGSERMPTVTTYVAEGLTVVEVAPAREAGERRIAAVAAGRLRRPVLVLGIAGA